MRKKYHFKNNEKCLEIFWKDILENSWKLSVRKCGNPVLISLINLGCSFLEFLVSLCWCSVHDLCRGIFSETVNCSVVQFSSVLRSGQRIPGPAINKT